MITVFVEYKLSQEQRNYVSSIPAIQEYLSGLEVIEHKILTSCDQLGIIVEVFEVKDHKIAEQLRRYLLDKGQLEHKKLNIWIFKQVNM